MWDLIVSVPDHCLSFYSVKPSLVIFISCAFLASKGLLFQNLFILIIFADLPVFNADSLYPAQMPASCGV